MPPHHPIEKHSVSEMGSSVQNTRLWTQLKKPSNIKTRCSSPEDDISSINYTAQKSHQDI